MSLPVYPTLLGATPEVERRQIYNSRLQQESGGRGLSLGARTQAVYHWTLTYGFITASELVMLSKFVHGLGGANGLFQFTDPITPTATNWLFRSGIGTGSTLATGNGSWTVGYCGDWNGDPVGPLDWLTCRIAGVIESGLTLSFADGALKVTFATPPPNGASVNWSGAYNRICRLVEDGLTIKQVVPGAYTAEVQIVSQVLPT